MDENNEIVNENEIISLNFEVPYKSKRKRKPFFEASKRQQLNNKNEIHKKIKHLNESLEIYGKYF